MEIKNAKKAAKRILKAIEKSEKIVIYGDADLDGVASVIIMKEAVKSLGGNVCGVYFPDREVEGYGISEIGLDILKGLAPALFIALDCGIGNFKEVKMAKKLGFEVIIIDHHEILDKLPEASIIVDPKQKTDKYPFKGLAAAGVTFKVVEFLLGDKMTENLRRNFLELTALATIADMMPQKEDNEIFIQEGILSLEKSWRPGIKAFFETELIKGYPSLSQKISKINSILNIRDIENNLPASFRLLTYSSLAEVNKLIEKLIKKIEARNEKIKEITEEVEVRIFKNKTEPIIFEGDNSFELILISSVASSLCQKYLKPIFLYKKMEKESQGTVRAPKDVDTVALMKKCSEYPLTYGGHAQASGFRIENEKLEKFKSCLIKNYNPNSAD